MTTEAPPRQPEASSSAGGISEIKPLTGRVAGFLRGIPTWLLWFFVVVWTVPTVGLLINSFRTRDAMRGSGWWLFWQDSANGYGGLTLDNYRDILGSNATGGVANGLLNSMAIAVVATIIPIAIAAFAAYAFAWIDFRGRNLLFIATVALLAVPSQVALIPLLQMYAGGAHFTIPLIDKTLTVFPDLDLAGTIPAVWLTHTGFALPFAIFLLHNYISGLPADLFESARIDGADHFTIFRKIVVPLSVPVLAAFTIFQFLWTWNDYLIALTMIGGNREALPATVVVASLAGEFGLREELLTAGAWIITVVPLIVFFALQRFFVRGITAGSVKG